MKLKTGPKLLLIALAVGAVYLGVRWGQDHGYIPKKKVVQMPKSNLDINTLEAFKTKYNMTRPLRVGICTWGGYAGGAYENNGFVANVEGEFYKKYGILVDIVLNDDLNTSLDSWKSGDVDIMWGTVDAFSTLTSTLPDNPQTFMQIDWSRGGDAIVAKRGITSVNDLKGKKIAVALGTPSHSLLLKSLEAANMKPSDVTIVTANSAPEAAQFFKAGKVDAAVVWSPDDQDCLNTVAGSTAILSTKNASNIIADMLFAKKAFLEQHEDLIKAFTEGWLTGNATVNSSPDARTKAADIMSKNMNQSLDFCDKAIGNVRLVTYGDNVNFFNLKGTYSGVKAQDLYTQMADMYKNIGYIKNPVPGWNVASYSKALRSITLTDAIHAPEGMKSFAQATSSDAISEAISNKTVSITFPSGSFVLTDEAKTIVDQEMLPIANQFASSRIRIQGNTDNVGNATANKILSSKRAKAVSTYLISQYGFDKNRFVVVGNGPDKPIADNSTDEGRTKNRRTDFEVIK